MKRLALVAVLAVVLLIASGCALTSCDPGTGGSGPVIEIDLPKVKKPPAVKAPSFRAPSTTRKR